MTPDEINLKDYWSLSPEEQAEIREVADIETEEEHEAFLKALFPDELTPAMKEALGDILDLDERSHLMKQATLYTFGYLSTRSERIISELIAVKTPVVDIRYRPQSRRWQYCQEMLSGRPGILYYWIQELGNEHYKEALSGKYSEPHVKLHDAETGLLKLQAILDTHGRVALMCACASSATCHRRVVADLASRRLGINVIHL